jgi:hypothetical protein
MILQKNISHIATSFFPLVTLLMFILLSFSGCEDKKSESPLIPMENTTEIFTTKDKQVQAEKSENIKKQNNTSNTSNTYILKDKHLTHKITLNNKKIIFHDIHTPVVMLKIYKPNCSLCILQSKPLNTLKKAHRKKFSILSIVDTEQNKEITNLLHTVRTTIGITEDSSLPLNVIYKNGKYYSHFEGSVPIEMISHDILEAIKK